MGINTPTWGNLSPTRRQAFERATDLGYATAGGDKLIQDYINRTIQQLTLREWGLTNALDRRPGSGSQAIINRRTASDPGAAWVLDNVDPTSVVGDYAQVAFSYQTLATRGTVSRKLMAMGASYSDVLADEMAAKAEDFMYQLELTATAGFGTGATPSGFLQLANTVGTAQVVDASNSAGDNQALTLVMMDEMIDKVKGASNRSDLVIVCSPLMGRKINDLLQSVQRFSDMVEIAAGFRVKTYDGIPIVQSTGMPDACAGVSGTHGSRVLADASDMFTSGDGGIIACINKRYAWIEELTPMTVLPLAKTTSANDGFDMYMDAALVLANTKGIGLIEALLTT